MSTARERNLLYVARVIGGIVAMVGTLVLIGWQFDIPALKSVAPQFVTMKANTALCFVLAGAQLLLATDRAGFTSDLWRVGMRLPAIILITVGAMTLAEYVFGIDLRIDQLLFAEVQTPLTPNPGRMSPATAVNFILVGVAFLILDVVTHRKRYPAQWLTLVVFAIGYTAVMGYVYDVQVLYKTVMYTSVAVHTAALFVLLAIGMLLARPAQGFMHVVVGDSASGVLLRRLLPVAILLPPVVDWLQVHASDTEDSGYRIVLAAMINVAFLVVFAWWTANSVRLAEIARRSAEAAAKTGEERLRIALQAAGAGAWDWDLANNVAWWSPEMYALWNVAPGTTMRLDNSLALIHELDRETVNKVVDEAIAKRTPYHCEFRLSGTPPGQERWMASRGRVVFDDAGNPARLVGISLDMAEQKRTERELRLLNDALERSNVELKHFAHAASHDLQTPMRSVASFAELLQAKYAPQLAGQGSDWIARIVQSVQQLQTIVRDLLRYARLDSPPQPFAAVNMRDLFQRVVSLLDAAIRESAAQVTADDLPVVQGDATQLTELLLNLIGNALKYRSKEPPRVHIAVQRIDDAWRFAVSDRGIGIEPRHHERIFETFRRLHNQQQYPGTGIGLAICRRVVQTHGGKIWVESEPGRGSTFFFTLPDNAAA
jgi:signal transduction histidine kinase